MTREQRNIRRRLCRALERDMRACVGREMVWGKDDCALFHALAEIAARGVDPCADYRGRYRTQRGARRALGPGGLPAVLRKAARRHGWRKVKPARARVGDLGLIVVADGVAVVRMLHRGEWIGRNEFGWSMVPTDKVRLAWSVA